MNIYMNKDEYIMNKVSP